jgi:ATP-binding cassette subfamily B (MDR/TAP) protein 1
MTRNIRYEYLKTGLRQEVAYYDTGDSGSVAMQATSNGKLIQAGISEKLGMVFQGLSAFVAGFVLAFVTQWKLTLICCCIAPATLLVVGAASTFDASLETQILKVHAQSGSFAESILSSAPTIHAFGLRNRLIRNFDQYLKEAHRLGNKKSIIFGFMFSAEYFITFAGMGLCFWQGIKMLARGEVGAPGDIFM